MGDEVKEQFKRHSLGLPVVATARARPLEEKHRAQALATWSPGGCWCEILESGRALRHVFRRVALAIQNTTSRHLWGAPLTVDAEHVQALKSTRVQRLLRTLVMNSPCLEEELEGVLLLHSNGSSALQTCEVPGSSSTRGVRPFPRCPRPSFLAVWGLTLSPRLLPPPPLPPSRRCPAAF